MKMKYWLITLALVFLTQACVIAPVPPASHGGNYHQGPPAHAPAHGYRAKHRYYYYPDVSVYFDLDRRLYFYLDRGWQVAARLPRELRLGLYGPVTIEMDLDKPYSRYDEHRRKYPPRRDRKKYKKW
jgi:hypothetical protein